MMRMRLARRSELLTPLALLIPALAGREWEAAALAAACALGRLCTLCGAEGFRRAAAQEVSPSRVRGAWTGALLASLLLALAAYLYGPAVWTWLFAEPPQQGTWTALWCVGAALPDVYKRQDMDNAAVAARAASDRYLFFSALSDFPAPLGKYAALAEEDALPEQLAQAMAVGGVRLLNGESVSLTRDGQALTLAGIGPDGDLSGLAASVRGADCVVAFTHSPARFPAALTAEAADGGPWADMILAGGTHGGQMRAVSYTHLDVYKRQGYGCPWAGSISGR